MGEGPEHAGTERVNLLYPLTAELWTLVRTRKVCGFSWANTD